MSFRVAGIFVLSLCAVFVGRGSIASSAPVSLQYDEIVRVVVGQATPPPPGAFQADLAAIQNPPSDQTAQAPPKKHGFGNLLGAVLSGQSPIDAAGDNLAENAVSNAMGGMLGSLNAFSAFMKGGKVARYTYYNGWERVDDTAAQTATISKFDRNQIITLDLAKKTYRTVDTSVQPATEATAAPSKRSSRSKPESGPPEQPGTAVVDLTRQGTALGSQVLDGISTSGYSNKMTLSMTQATGSCRNGSFSMSSSQYFSHLAEPQTSVAPSSAARPMERVPTDPRSVVSRGGCTPTFTVHNSGPTPPLGRFMMYSNVALQPQDASASNGSSSNGSSSGASTFAFVTERGNVHSLSPSVAAAMFEIPAGFVPEP
jgi:hypothetical protein